MMMIAQALQLLHKHHAREIGKAPGKRWQPPKTLADVQGSILRKFEMFLARDEVSEEQRKRDEAECATRRAGT